MAVGGALTAPIATPANGIEGACLVAAVADGCELHTHPTGDLRIVVPQLYTPQRLPEHRRVA